MIRWVAAVVVAVTVGQWVAAAGAQPDPCDSNPPVTTNGPCPEDPPDDDPTTSTTTSTTTTTTSTTTTTTTTTEAPTTTATPTTEPPTSLPTTTPPELEPGASTTTAVVAEFQSFTQETPDMTGAIVLWILGIVGAVVVLGAGVVADRRR